MNQPLQTLAKLAEAVGVDYSAINSDEMIIQTAEAALKRIEELHRAVLEEIEHRDDHAESADMLAGEIARFFEVDIGEHSTANHPWDNAFDAVPEGTMSELINKAEVSREAVIYQLRIAVVEGINALNAIEVRGFPGDLHGFITLLQSALTETPTSAVERLKNEWNCPTNENGTNRYGLDVAYFRNLFNRELNRTLQDYRPAELARNLLRMARTADKSIIAEAEFTGDLKAQWQAEQYSDGMPAQKAFWEGFERGVMNGAVNIRAHWNEYKQRVQEAGDE